MAKEAARAENCQRNRETNHVKYKELSVFLNLYCYKFESCYLIDIFTVGMITILITTVTQRGKTRRNNMGPYRHSLMLTLLHINKIKS